MNTLTGIEADRVNAILKHSLDRLHVLSHIPTEWDDDLIVDIKSQTVLNSLEKLWMAEEQLKELDFSQKGMKDMQIIRTTHKMARNAFRSFTADKSSLQIIMKRLDMPTEDFSKFIQCLSDFKNMSLERMKTTVEDEISKRIAYHDLTEKERSYEDMTLILERKLNELRKEKQDTTYGLNQTLRKLQNELENVNNNNKTNLDDLSKEMNEAVNKATADHELRTRQLQDRVDAMERVVNETVEKNREEEQRLRREKIRAESLLNAKISLYDEDMRKKTNQLKELKEKYMAEQKEYAMLKAHFDKIDADNSRNNEENALVAAAKLREAYGHWVLFFSATRIQKIIRGRRDRVTVAKMRAKGKKGKKGTKKVKT